MRIAILTNAYPPTTRGGAGRIAEMQAEILRTAGHDVHVFCPDIPWLKQGLFVRIVAHFNDLKVRKTVRDEIVTWRPDVLISHNLTGCGFGTPQAVRTTGVRWIHVLHDVQLFEPSGQLRNAGYFTDQQHAWSFIRRSALGTPDVVISPTKWLLEHHVRRGFFRDASTGCVVLPNPSPALLFHPRPSHDPLRVLFMGHLSPQKGTRMVERLARRSDLLCEWHVVSRGPDEERLKNLPRVTMHGFLETPAVLSLMESCDVLVVPSQIIENQPTIILEAASRGLPVIASKIGGIPETLGEAGILCAPKDKRAWIDALRSLRDPSVYFTHVQKMERLATEHDPSSYRQNFLSLLTSKR